VSERSIRITGYAGVASFVLIAIAAMMLPLWNAPDTTASAAEVSTYVTDHRGEVLASLFLYSLGIGLFLCFAAGLWVLLRSHEPQPGLLSAAFAFGVVCLVALVFAGFAPVGVLAYREVTGPDAQLLNDLTFGLLALSGIPTAVCLGAFGALVLRRTPALPAWTGWLAGLGAVAHVVIAASFLSRSGFLSLEGDVIIWVPGTFFAWILAVGSILAGGWSADDSPR
jgi:hypothetical protein